MPADAAAAAEWFQKAAERDHVLAQYNLALAHAGGLGVARDPGALFNLGVLCANGTGVAQDAVRAFVLLAMAVRRASGPEAARYAQSRDTVGASLSPAQLADAQRLAVGDELPWAEPAR